jgi:hypothetical protein
VFFNTLDGRFTALCLANMSVYPDLEMDTSRYKKINLDTLNKAQMNQWQVGDTLLLTGTIPKMPVFCSIVSVNLSIRVAVVGPAGPITSPFTAATGPT